MDRPKPSPVPSGQVLVQSLDGTDSGELPELLVHVVGSRSRVVSEPDTKVLDLEGSLLVDLRGVTTSSFSSARDSLLKNHFGRGTSGGYSRR